jgi:hypothetical protein
MLTDDDLRELIDAGAAQAPPPASLPDELFHVDPPRVRSIVQDRQIAKHVASVAAVVVVLGLLVAGLGALTTSTSDSKSSTTASPARLDPSLSSASSGGGAAGTAAGAAPTPQGAAAQGAGAVPPPTDSTRIVKNGSLELRIGKDAVTESVNRLTALAAGFGGYVSDTRTTASAESGAQASATISVRVPVGAFEQLIAEASKLGEVRSTTTSGQDVTAQYTDIEAQLTALGATRDQLLTVLGEAQNVPDILSVQDRITQVQIQIDQLEGQRRMLDSQTSYGTLSVTLLEPGATAAVPVRGDDSDLGDAWRKARDTFVDGIEWIVSATGTLALLALVGAVLGGGGWLVYRRARRQII